MQKYLQSTLTAKQKPFNWTFAVTSKDSMTGRGLTSENTTLLEVVHALARITFAQFLADKARHHATHPLLTNDGIAGVVNGDVVLEVDALVGRGDGGLFGEERGGLGGGHCEWVVWIMSEVVESFLAEAEDNGSKICGGETCRLEGLMRWSGVDLEGWITWVVIGWDEGGGGRENSEDEEDQLCRPVN
jgi:hypothetical protein